MPGGSGMSFTFRHMALVEYETTEEATKAAKYMDGGQIDGQEVMVTIVKPTRADRYRRRSPRKSPPRKQSKSPARARRRDSGPGRDKSRSPRRKKTPEKAPAARRRRHSTQSSSSDGTD